MNYIPKYFKAHELVPPAVYSDRREKSFELIDWRVLVTLDKLRERYGPITVNNWYWDRDRVSSGLRIPSSPHYTTYSQHTHGRAADCIFKYVNADLVRQDILKNPDDDAFQFITFLEMDISWLHFDCRNCDRIMTWSPK